MARYGALGSNVAVHLASAFAASHASTIWVTFSFTRGTLPEQPRIVVEPSPLVTEVPPMQHRLAYPIAEAADRIGVGRTTLYELLNSGELPSIRVRGRRLVTESALVAYLDHLSEQAA